MLDTAEQALAVAGEATQDTVAVALEGYEATPRQRDRAVQHALRVPRRLRADAALDRGIRGGWWPLGNVELGGRHIHHFVPGILLAFAAGGAGLVTEPSGSRQTLAIPFGAGIGLTFDEAALLLDLARRLLDPRGRPQRPAQPRPRGAARRRRSSPCGCCAAASARAEARGLIPSSSRRPPS